MDFSFLNSITIPLKSCRAIKPALRSLSTRLSCSRRTWILCRPSYTIRFYVPWGGDNQMPFDLLALVKQVETLAPANFSTLRSAMATSLRYDTCIASSLA